MPTAVVERRSTCMAGKHVRMLCVISVSGLCCIRENGVLWVCARKLERAARFGDLEHDDFLVLASLALVAFITPSSVRGKRVCVLCEPRPGTSLRSWLCKISQ